MRNQLWIVRFKVGNQRCQAVSPLCANAGAAFVWLMQLRPDVDVQTISVETYRPMAWSK